MAATQRGSGGGGGWRPRRLGSRLAMGPAFLLAALCLAQAPGGSEEVRVGSRPYVPFQLRTETTVVQIAVVVRDGKGRAVSGLQKDDFRLTDQGKDRMITSFTVDARDVPGGAGVVAGKGRETAEVGTNPAPTPVERPHPPRFISMYFDDIGTAAGDLARMKKDAARFVEAGMSPGDRMAIVVSSAGRFTDFLTNKEQIAAAIEKVQAHPRFPPGGNSNCPRMTPYDAYLIANYLSQEALQAKILELLACAGTPPQYAPAGGRGGLPRPGQPDAMNPAQNLIRQLAAQMWEQVKIASQATMDSLADALTDLSKQNGTRTLLLVSSGFLSGTMEETEDSLADQALKASVVINAMDAKGLYVEGPAHPFGEPVQMENVPTFVTMYETMTQNAAAETPTAILADLAEATGGLFFHHNNDFSFGFRELGSIPEVTYLLGFSPEDASLDSKYHKLKVKLAASNSYTIEARPGYFAMRRTAPVEDKGRAELDRQVIRSETVQQFPATVRMQYGPKNTAGATPVHIQMHVDLKALKFGQQNARRTQKLTFVFALLDDKDAIVSAREGSMDFALSDAKYQSLLQSGVNAALTLEAPGGSYRLRAVAIESAEGQMAALAYRIQVP